MNDDTKSPSGRKDKTEKSFGEPVTEFKARSGEEEAAAHPYPPAVNYFWWIFTKSEFYHQIRTDQSGEPTRGKTGSGV